MKKKRILKLLFVVVLMAGTMIHASAAQSGEMLNWNEFRGNSESAGITDAKTPIDGSTKITSQELGFSHEPIYANGFLYYVKSDAWGSPSVKQLLKLDENFNIVATAELMDYAEYTPFLAYGDGMVFVAVKHGVIQAFDADTMKPLWQSEKQVNTKGYTFDIVSPITYFDGYIYTSLSRSSGAEGKYIAISVKDEDPSRQDEVKKLAWTYDGLGYYWSGAAIANGNDPQQGDVIFANAKGQLISVDAKSGLPNDTYDLKGDITSSIHYDATLHRAYVVSKDGKLHSIGVDTNGTFKTSTYRTKVFHDGVNMTSTPVTYNGRLYVTGGGYGVNACFRVLDASTLDVIYEIPEIMGQASPIISTAYANKENNNEVYIYSFAYDKNEMYIIKDSSNNTKPSYQKVTYEHAGGGTAASAVIGSDGSIYLQNFNSSSGYLTKFSGRGAYTADDVIQKIDMLPYSIRPSDEVMVTRLYERYQLLDAADKGKVTNFDVLNKAYQTIQELKDMDKLVTKLIHEIDELPLDITLKQQSTIDELWNLYTSLRDEYKAKVHNANTLTQAKQHIDALLIDQQILHMNKNLANMKGSGEIALSEKAQLKSWIDQIEAMPADAQSRIIRRGELIANYQIILDSEAKITHINQLIWDTLDPLHITMDDEVDINAIDLLYAQLRIQDRTLVNGYEDVTYAKAVIEGLKNNQVIKEVFEHIKGQNKEYVVNKVSKEGITYSFKFNGLDIKDAFAFHTNIYFKSLKNQSKIEKLAKDAFVISFAHDGALPGIAKVNIHTGLHDGTYQLYYFNELTQQAEFISDVQVSKGDVEFMIEHSSDYFLTTGLISDVNTGDTTNITPYIIMLAAALVIIIILVLRRKKDKEKK